MNELKAYLGTQLCAHPSMTPQDVVKLCYQAACGAEHLLSDLSGARAYFEEEFAAVEERNEPLVEPISRDICRVNLGAWKKAKLPAQLLFDLFSKTVFDSDGKQRLTEYLTAAESVLRDHNFDMAAWESYVTEYIQKGMPAVRHSVQYREAEQPAYRIVSREYMKEYE